MSVSTSFKNMLPVSNYFDLFELPMSFDIEKKSLTSLYYKLSRQWHPDRFSTASAEEQEKAMTMSAEINKGYKVLQNPNLRVHHILQCLDAAPEEGKDKMSQEFLMEMMDLNEAIMDYKMDPSDDTEKALGAQIIAYETEWRQELDAAIVGFDFNAPAPDKLLAIKEYYLKSKYLRRLQDNIRSNESEM